jgi:hypothetical protein
MGGIPFGHLCPEPRDLLHLPGDLRVAIGKAPLQTGEPFPENLLMLAYAGWIGRFRRAYAGIGWRCLW